MHRPPPLAAFPFLAVAKQPDPSCRMDCEIAPDKRRVRILSNQKMQVLFDLDFCSRIPMLPDE